MEDLALSKSDPAGDAIRRWGFLAARFDPLSRIPPVLHPAIENATPTQDRLKQIYMGSLAVEFMHLPFPDRCKWIAQRMEEDSPPTDKSALIESLSRAEIFEQVLQAHYVGTKRFSLEGLASLIPLLDQIVRGAAYQGCDHAVIGMAHRGRLNVMVNLLGKPAREIFARFEDSDPGSVLGSGDVKYHLGAKGRLDIVSGKTVELDLVSNPSHLEAVDPVVQGVCRADQDRRNDSTRGLVLPILLHGDAALAGQGIAAETFNLSELTGYTVGGTIHVVLNNMIGFTTPPSSLYSSRLATDVARRLPIPIFHVSAEDPEQVVRVAGIAVAYRYAFGSDVMIDLVGYRRHGHSEVDDPTTTQPRLYRAIASLPPLYESYARKSGWEQSHIDSLAQRIREYFTGQLEEARHRAGISPLSTPARQWEEFRGGPYDPGEEVITAVPITLLQDLGRRLSSLPRDFHVHPKVSKVYEARREMAEGHRSADWGMAEALALATLLNEGIGIRLTGQDSRRGTFNHRHAVLIDTETEHEFVPFNHLRPDQQEFLECIDSPLSEGAPLGFEYGYSREFPERLVAWEAQFGDFANGAQVLIDQFLCSAEDKWDQLSGLTLLLPHGYEGQGPEHSHARPERFLQLAARDAIQVCQPTTAAQYFHLLRRQVLRRWRKPLIVFTPKAMLRHPASSSPLEVLAEGAFTRVLVGLDRPNAKRIIVCTGKVLHELRYELERRNFSDTALVSIEELYPFPEKELEDLIIRFPDAGEIRWVQEEPANMGALCHVLPALERVAAGREIILISRPPNSTPATGSSALHRTEQSKLIEQAISPSP